MDEAFAVRRSRGVSSSGTGSSPGRGERAKESFAVAPVGTIGEARSKPSYLNSERISRKPESLDQLPGLPIAGKTTFREYMQRVETSNLDLAAQRFNVPISKGQLLAARIYPDPDFQAGYGGDVSGQRQATTYEGNLSQTILLGGKIGARTEAANATLQASQAQLSDFLRNLRALAANSYIDAVTGLLTLQQQIKALQKAQQLVDLNTRRVEANQTSEDDLIRARINELEERGKVIRYESSLHQTLIAMAALAGDQSDAGLVVPTGRLQIPPRQFSLESLLAEAVSSRSDVIAAARQLDDARAEYQIAKANRVPDLTVGGAYAHETRVTNPIDPAPAWDSLGISLSIPIPLSDLNQGPTEAAYYLQSQAEEECGPPNSEQHRKCARRTSVTACPKL